MPGPIDGIALAKLAQTRFPQLKLIIASSRQLEVSPRADAFLCKPYDLHKMIEEVERVLAPADNE
jgi:hypothetical protein